MRTNLPSKRLAALLSSLGLALAACDGPARDPAGPQADPPRPDIVQVDLGGDPGLEGPLSDICGTEQDPNDPSTLRLKSPCDGAHNTPPSGEPFTASFYFLPSLVENPGTVGPNFTGAASRLAVRVYPYPDAAACQALGGTSSQCAVKELPVTEASGKYSASWKTSKKGGGPDVVPAESYWQVVVLLDRDGDRDGDGDPFEADEDLGSRIVKQTDAPPSADKDAWAISAQWGSNTEVPFVLATNGAGCFGIARDLDQVECLVDLDQGGTLILETGNGAVILDLGAQNGLGTRTVAGELCTLAGGNTAIEGDIPTRGTCTNWTIDPPLTQVEKDAFTSSFIYVCESLSSLPDIGSYAVHMQDDLGTVALVPVDASAACQAEGFMASAGDGLPLGLDGLWRRLASLVGPRPLVATGTAMLHGSPGGSLGGVGIGSDFQLARPTSVDVTDPGSSPLTQVLPVNGSTTLTLKLEDEEGDPVPGATMLFFSDGVSSVACVAGDANCDETVSPPNVPAGGSVVQVDSDVNGLVSAVWTVQDQTARVWALGCHIAVPGSDTPVDGGFAGDGGPCDRDPADRDGSGDINVAANYPDGFANGPLIGLTDVFMAPPGFGTAVWPNDLPVEFTAQVCGSPTVDGLKGATEWQDACIPASHRASFQVKLSGNRNDQPFADVKWFVGPDRDDPTVERIYFSIELPLSSAPSKTAAAIELDAGDGISGVGVPSEFDDQLEIRLESNMPAPGQVFDRYLTASCASNSSTNVCNALDGDDGFGGQTAQGAVRYDSGGFLFYEFSQLLDGDARDIRVASTNRSSVCVGAIFQIGVGNVKQGGTIYPEPLSGGQKVYQDLNLSSTSCPY